MITILPHITETDQKIIFEAKDKDEVLGNLIAILDLEKSTVLLKDIKSVPFLEDGIKRAALSYALNRGIKQGQIEGESGFIDLEKFFIKKC